MFKKKIQWYLCMSYFAVLISFGLCCTNDEWECDSGQCIVKADLCDGKINCLDKSDETEVQCFDMDCPEYAFKCAYGACVSGNAKCNSMQDCADNSDEVSSLCAKEINDAGNVISSCKHDEFRCNSNKCISMEKSCDGLADCDDQSDETEDSCSINPCPDHAFRCKYGACINKEKVCDHTDDCRDLSDEDLKMCGPSFQGCVSPIIQNGELVHYHDTTKMIPSETLLPNTTTIAYKCNPGYKLQGAGSNECSNSNWVRDQPSCEITTLSTSGCRPPSHLGGVLKYWNLNTSKSISTPGKMLPNNTLMIYKCENGYRLNGTAFNICENANWKSSSHPTCVSEKPQLDTNCQVPHVPNAIFRIEVTNASLIPGDMVQHFVGIIYTCEPGYNRVGLPFYMCNNSMWNNHFNRTRCIKYCSPESLQDISFNSTCIRNGTGVACSDPIEPGTTAKIICAIKYRTTSKKAQLLTCGDDGEWDKELEKPCEELCGIKKEIMVPFRMDGTNSNITEVPWHVAIYSRLPQQFTYICGGSIISARLVISAAHCFWNFKTRSKYDSSYFTVAAGKASRHYQTLEEHAQFQNISKIHIPSEFDIDKNNYKADIAVLELTEFFKLSENVAPVCIEWKENAEKIIHNSKQGKISGWGIMDSDDANASLQIAEVNTLSYHSCLDSIGKDLGGSVETDKFCVEKMHGVTLSEGFSGGGFVVEQDYNQKTIHYLWGVISTGLSDSSNETKFVTYTNIQFHEPFIIKYFP